tara:strand:- start:7351 stop:8748 length:1398 start_codon:yes stop_codon:yes gene_type:complete
MKKNIFIIIESAKRELDCRILLSLKLIRNNFNVVIGHKGSLYQIIDKLNPGIIFFKSLGPMNNDIIKKLKKKNFKLIACDEELLASTNINSILDFRIEKTNYRNLDLMFAVGKYDGDALTKKFGEGEKVKQVGNLRLDILREPIRKVYNSEVKEIKSLYGDYFLLATQFGRVNAQNKNNDFMIDAVFSLIVDGHNPDSEIVKTYKNVFNYQRENLEKTIEFIKEFSKIFPEKKLLLKPHPNEKRGFWEHFIHKNSFKNIQLINDKKFSTNAIILAAECVIACNSTLLLEAHFLNQKCINYLPVTKDDNVEKDLLIQASKTIRNLDDLIDQLKKIDTFNIETDEEKMKKYIANYNNKKFSTDLIVENIDNLDTRLFKSLYKNKLEFLKIIFFSFKVNIKTLLKKIIKYEDPDRYQKQMKKMQARKIGNYMNKYNFNKRVNILNNQIKGKKVIIKELVPNVYKLNSE